MMSPAAKRLPGTTPQRAIVPSVIVSPSFGMTRSVAVITSASCKCRRALFEKRGAAFVCIRGIEHETDHALFVGQCGRKRHVCTVEQGPLQQLEHQRALGRNFCRECARFREHVCLWYELVG